MYRTYVCTALNRILPAFGSEMRLSYLEAVGKLGEAPDARTGDEIAADVISRLGLEVTA